MAKNLMLVAGIETTRDCGQEIYDLYHGNLNRESLDKFLAFLLIFTFSHILMFFFRLSLERLKGQWLIALASSNVNQTYSNDKRQYRKSE
jgi:hypothetical protein